MLPGKLSDRSMQIALRFSTGARASKPGLNQTTIGSVLILEVGTNTSIKGHPYWNCYLGYLECCTSAAIVNLVAVFVSTKLPSIGGHQAAHAAEVLLQPPLCIFGQR